MTRIRYVRNKVADPTILVSKSNIVLPNGLAVSIRLDTQTNTYVFLDLASGNVYSEGTAKNLLTLKKLIRNTLLELGVPLEVEVKKSKKTQEEAA